LTIPGTVAGREADDDWVLFRFGRGYKWDVEQAATAVRLFHRSCLMTWLLIGLLACSIFSLQLDHTLEWKKSRAAYKADAAGRSQRELVNAEKVMTYYPHKYS
jgi:hypothetical protein